MFPTGAAVIIWNFEFRIYIRTSYSVLSILYFVSTMYFVFTLYFVLCTLYFVFCTLYFVLCILYFVLCILYSVLTFNFSFSSWVQLDDKPSAGSVSLIHPNLTIHFLNHQRTDGQSEAIALSQVPNLRKRLENISLLLCRDALAGI